MKAQPNPNVPPLDAKHQRLATISALTATGKLEQLKTAVGLGLDDGLTVNEIKEAMVQLYAYCGFPRSLNAITTLQAVLETRKANGITDKQGKAGQVENNVADKYEQGRKTLETLTKTPQPKPAPGFGAFAPRIDVFLKEHLFADIFANDVLTYRQRELVTISALAAMDGVEPQLKSHVGLGQLTGITNEQLAQIADIIEHKVGITQANTLLTVLGQAQKPTMQPDMLVRIAEVEVLPDYRDAYLAILKKGTETSIATEPGVLSLYPMITLENPNRIRILEIYASKEAYQAHIRSAHFQEYKTSTLKMIKDLKLVDMQPLTKETTPLIFKKLNTSTLTD